MAHSSVGQEVQKPGAGICSVFGELPFYTVTCQRTSHGASDQVYLPKTLLLQQWMPTQGPHFLAASNPNYLWKALLPNTVSTWIFGGHILGTSYSAVKSASISHQGIDEMGKLTHLHLFCFYYIPLAGLFATTCAILHNSVLKMFSWNWNVSSMLHFFF